MKKIFSLALMATALLISGQVKAATSVSDFKGLKDAFKNGGDYIVTGPITITETLQMYAMFSEQGKVVNLDLNGQTVTSTVAGPAIEIFKGTLNLTTSKEGGNIDVQAPYTFTYNETYQKAKGGSKIAYTSVGRDPLTQIESKQYDAEVGTMVTLTEKSRVGFDAVVLHGVYEDKQDWTNLTIGKGVKVSSDNYNAITVMNFYGMDYYLYADSVFAGKICDGVDGLKLNDPDYATYAAYKFAKNDKGLDYATSTGRQALTAGRVMGDGVTKLDWTSSVPKYGTKVTSAAISSAGLRHYVTRSEYAKANGVNVKIEGTVFGYKYGIKVNGTLGTPSLYQPNIIITRDGKVTCATTTAEDLGGKESVAVYCSGQANWLVQGTVEGNIGMSIKAGQVNISDATITATGTNYEGLTWKSDGSGCNGGSGCAIIVESKSNYGGEQAVTISGDSKITSESGLALAEVVTTASSTKISQIAIEGGSFASGNAEGETMQFTSSATDKVTIKSGDVEGEIKIEGSQLSTEEVLHELMPNGTYAQEIEGKQVITTGGKPVACAKIDTASTNTNVKLTGATQTLTVNKVLATVELPEATVLTLANNVKLTVSKLVFSNADAQIIVPYNSALIVTGNEGAYTLNEDNIVLQAKGDTLATFLFSANVVNNKQPMATVEYNATAKEYGAGEYDYDWNRLSVPFEVVYGRETVNKDEIKKFGDKSWTTYYRVWKDNAWTVTSIMDATSYQGLAMTNVSLNGDAKYKFKGLLQGAKQGILNIKKGWNYFGNSYTAKMDIKELLKQMPSSVKTIKIFDAASQSYKDVSVALIIKGIAKVKDIPAMQTFIFYSEEDATIDLNYEPLVWDYYNK